jgi:hypothetical protein
MTHSHTVPMHGSPSHHSDGPKLSVLMSRFNLSATYKKPNADSENKNHNDMMPIPVAPPGATMAISFQSDEEVLRKLQERLRKMSDEELIKFGKEVRRLADRNQVINITLQLKVERFR